MVSLRDLWHMHRRTRDGRISALEVDMLKTKICRELFFLLALVVTLFSPALAFAQRQAFPDLVSLLKATPGCLGVETATTGSGKRVIFAWFANRQALLAWVKSDAHVRLMGMAGGPSGREPLAGIPDDGRPILTIASLTMSEQPPIPGLAIPVSQIAIELYAPLPGGLAAGGRFAPDGVEVPGLLAR